jgi:outer membrane protein TolC
MPPLQNPSAAPLHRPRARPALAIATVAVAIAAALASCDDALRPAPFPGPTAQPATPPRPAQAMTVAIPARPLAVADCVALALARNHAISRAGWRTQAALAATSEARAGSMPTLAADAMATTRNNQTGATLGGMAFVTDDRSIAAGDLTATLPLWNAGNPPGRSEAAEHAFVASLHDLGAARADVALAVTSAVCDVEEEGARATAIGDSVAALAGEAALAEELRTGGLGLPTDAMAARVRQAEREQDRLQAAHAHATAAAHLDRLLALPIDATLALAPLPASAAPAPEEAALRAQALRLRPELLAARERAREAGARITEARAGGEPSLSANGGWHATTDSYVLNRQWFSAGVSLQVPLFDGGATAARTDAARARAGEAAEAVVDLADAVCEQVHSAMLTLTEAQARLPVATQADLLAQDRLLLVQEQYKGGLTDMTTLLDAEDARVRAAIDLDHARFQIARGWALLRYVSGDGATSAP